MILFNLPPVPIYAHLQNLRRQKYEVENIESDTPLGGAFQDVIGRIGSGGVHLSLHSFPLNYSGVVALPPQANGYLYLILGSVATGGTSVNVGDVVRISSDVLVHATSFAPCVFAFFWFDNPEAIHFSSAYQHVPACAPAPQFVQSSSDNLASQIMVADHIDPAVCRRMIETLKPRLDGHQYGEVLTDAKDNKTQLMLEVRRTELMVTSDQKFVDSVLRDIVINRVEPFFQTTMEFWNNPVLLKYEPGGFFLAHVDGEQLKDGSWIRIYDRDYTLVAFLNEEYEGGELSFPEQNMSVTPKTGRVVAFPADHRFRHGAEKTLSGTRYQLVSWLTAYGTARTRTPPNPSVTYRSWE